MKLGLVLEGGAMRGMFTAGVTDVMMENGIVYDGTVGVSAGAVFGCNYKSNQPGRTIRYNTKYCNDPRYASFRSLLKTGDIYGEKFCYDEIPNKLDLFDYDAYENNPMEFYAVATDVKTGKAVYHKCEDCSENDLRWLRASASMPLVSRIVEVDGYSLLDGGMADSIPIKFFESKGYTKNVIVLTQPEGFVKEKNKMLPIMKVKLGKYPNLIETIAHRHEMYNETTAYIRGRELAGDAYVIRPKKKLEVGAVEHDAEKLLAVYEHGRSVAHEELENILKFIKKSKEQEL